MSSMTKKTEILKLEKNQYLTAKVKTQLLRGVLKKTANLETDKNS